MAQDQPLHVVVGGCALSSSEGVCILGFRPDLHRVQWAVATCSALMFEDGRMSGRLVDERRGFQPLHSVNVVGDDLAFWPAASPTAADDLGVRAEAVGQPPTIALVRGGHRQCGTTNSDGS